MPVSETPITEAEARAEDLRRHAAHGVERCCPGTFTGNHIECDDGCLCDSCMQRRRDEPPEFVATADPYPTRNACAFPDCSLSVEEHHRVGRGYAVENAELRRRLRERQPAQAVDIDAMPVEELLAALARRVR